MTPELILLTLLTCAHIVTSATLGLIVNEVLLFRRQCITERSYSSVAKCFIYPMLMGNLMLLLLNISCIGTQGELGDSLLVWLASQVIIFLETPIIIALTISMSNDNASDSNDNKYKLNALYINIALSIVLYYCMFICSLFIG